MKKMKFYEVRNTLKNIEPNKIYQSNNPDLLKPIYGNRGQASGVSKRTVRIFIDKYYSNKFHTPLAIISANLDGDIIEGASRHAMLTKVGEWYLFRILFDDIYNNKTRSELIEIIADCNDKNTAWTGKDNRDTAFLVGHPLAIRITELYTEMKNKYNLPKNKFKETLIFTLLERNPKNTHSRKRGVIEYDNKMLIERSYSTDLLDELEYVCKLITLLVLHGTTVDTSKVVEHTLFLKWNDESFNATNFLFNLQFDKFEIEGKMSKQTIVEEIKKMSANKKEIHMMFS